MCGMSGFDTGFFARGGETINFGYFRTAEQTNSVIIIGYSSAIDQFKYSHLVCLPVYHYINYACFSVCEGFARGGKLSLGGGKSQGSPPSVSNPACS